VGHFCLVLLKRDFRIPEIAYLNNDIIIIIIMDGIYIAQNQIKNKNSLRIHTVKTSILKHPNQLQSEEK